MLSTQRFNQSSAYNGQTYSYSKPMLASTPPRSASTAMAMGGQAIIDYEALALARGVLLDKFNYVPGCEAQEADIMWDRPTDCQRLTSTFPQFASHKDPRWLFRSLLAYSGGTSLDLPTFAAACDRLAVPVHPSQVDTLFRSVDLDGDGRIDYNDLAGFLAGKDSSRLAVPNLAASDMMHGAVPQGATLGPPSVLHPRDVGRGSAPLLSAGTPEHSTALAMPTLTPERSVASSSYMPTRRGSAFYPSMHTQAQAQVQAPLSTLSGNPGFYGAASPLQSRLSRLESTLTQLRSFVGKKWPSPRLAFLDIRSIAASVVSSSHATVTAASPGLTLDALLTGLAELQWDLPVEDVILLFRLYCTACATVVSDTVASAQAQAQAQTGSVTSAPSPGLVFASSGTNTGDCMGVHEWHAVQTGLYPRPYDGMLVKVDPLTEVRAGRMALSSVEAQAGGFPVQRYAQPAAMPNNAASTGAQLTTAIATQTDVLPSTSNSVLIAGNGRQSGARDGLASARSTGSSKASKRGGGKQARPPWRPLGRGPTHRVLL